MKQAQPEFAVHLSAQARLTLAFARFGLRHRTALLFLAVLALATTDLSVADDVYTYGQASRDGIGKFYMDREISHVMGHLGASWLERPERERQERTDRLVNKLPLQPDSVVADIGAGTGYFSFRIAKRVPQGKVIAVDIQPEMLGIIGERMAREAITNVEPLLGTERDPGLAENSVDLILLVDAYHEFSWPREMSLAMARALKPQGRLVLVEYRAEDPSVPIKPLHKMSVKQARREMKAVGLELERNPKILPQQHFMIFRRVNEG